MISSGSPLHLLGWICPVVVIIHFSSFAKVSVHPHNSSPCLVVFFPPTGFPSMSQIQCHSFNHCSFVLTYYRNLASFHITCTPEYTPVLDFLFICHCCIDQLRLLNLPVGVHRSDYPFSYTMAQGNCPLVPKALVTTASSVLYAENSLSPWSLCYLELLHALLISTAKVGTHWTSCLSLLPNCRDVI